MTDRPDLPTMKILFMANVDPDPDSGASGTEVQTINALRELGHRVDAVWKRDLRRRIRHNNLFNIFEFPRAYRDAMLERLSRESYDIVHVNQPFGYLAALALRQRREGARFVHRSHGFEGAVEADLREWRALEQSDSRTSIRKLASTALRPLLRRSQRLIAEHADGHIVSATRCRDFLVGEHDVAAERVVVIPQAPPRSYADAAAQAMTAERLLKILHVGQCAFVKGTPILSGAVTKVLKECQAASFTWVLDEADHPRVRALFPRDLEERIQLLGWTGQDSLRRIYDQHGIFLFPSFFEGFGKAFIEAMARGLVVVASDTGGMRDVITNGRDGHLCDIGDVDQFAGTCVQAMDYLDLSSRVATAARRTAVGYSWDRVARETAAFYRSLKQLPGSD